MKALMAEYTYRYDGKHHKSEFLLEYIESCPKALMTCKLPFTPPPQCGMSDEYKGDDTVLAFQQYSSTNQWHASVDIDLVHKDQKAMRLNMLFTKELYNRDEYDYVFMDCPPALNLITVNSLVAASMVIIPLQTEFYALEGLAQLLRTIEKKIMFLKMDIKETVKET